MDTTVLTMAYDDLLGAASSVAVADNHPVPSSGEWSADQILAHITLLNAATISTACSVASGAVATYDNRPALDTWTINRMISFAGGNEGLRDRVRIQAGALCAIVASLSEAELDTVIPTLLLSNDQLLLNDHVPLRTLIEGLASTEIPGHATQLRALLPAAAGNARV